MKRKILTIALLSLIALPLASCGDPKEDFTYEKYESDIIITNYIGKASKVTIPMEIEETRVSTIANEAFKNAEISQINMPYTLREIGEGAFKNCKNLEEVILPSYLYSLPDECFYDCSNLTYIEIPSTLTHIGENTFYNCSSLEKIIIPDNVLTIDENAFKGCMKLTIYCEVSNEQPGWHENWNPSYCDLVWNYK